MLRIRYGLVFLTSAPLSVLVPPQSGKTSARSLVVSHHTPAATTAIHPKVISTSQIFFIVKVYQTASGISGSCLFWGLVAYLIMWPLPYPGPARYLRSIPFWSAHFCKASRSACILSCISWRLFTISCFCSFVISPSFTRDVSCSSHLAFISAWRSSCKLPRASLTLSSPTPSFCARLVANSLLFPIHP